MSLEYDLKIETDTLTEELLVEEFQNSGYSCKNIARIGKGIVINEFQKTLGFTVYLTVASNYPYNCVDTIFNNKEFVFEKTLSFSFEKNFEKIDLSYKIMLDLIFNLMQKLETNALFRGNGENDFCYFDKEQKIYLNNINGIWNKSHFKDIIVGKNYLLYSGEPLNEIT